MSDKLYVQPEKGKAAFTCPHCGAFAGQTWEEAWVKGPTPGYYYASPVTTAQCLACNNYSYWVWSELVKPRPNDAPRLGDRFPRHIIEIHAEAAQIMLDSPRAALGLLRLCVDLVCLDRGATGDNLNKRIGSLVDAGVAQRIQKALDTIRILGNDALHETKYGDHDRAGYQEAVARCFWLLRYLDTHLYEEPAQVDKIYEELPAPKLEAVESRDKKKAPELP